MKLIDVLQKEAILVGLKSKNKKGVIRELVTPLARMANVDPDDLIRVLMEREKLGSTGIGKGIGIPHGKLKKLDSLILGFGVSHEGVDFESMDGQPVHIFFLLVTPETSIDMHLKMLARISGILKNELFIEKLLNAKDRDEVWEIICREDEVNMA